jgi:hypothetical protein
VYVCTHLTFCVCIRYCASVHVHVCLCTLLCVLCVCTRHCVSVHVPMMMCAAVLGYCVVTTVLTHRVHRIERGLKCWCTVPPCFVHVCAVLMRAVHMCAVHMRAVHMCLTYTAVCCAVLCSVL